MITIQEIKPPRKMSGLSSFLVTFKYQPQIVELMKTLPVFYYHKKDYAWEIPDTTLAKALDLLTFVDDIDLYLLKDDDEKHVQELTENEKKSFRIKPYDHQLDAINYGLLKEKWLLLDSMGVGKTNEIIWYAEALKRRGLIEHCMIICGVDSLRQNWKNEIQKFSTESCIVLGEKISKKGKISYETVAKRAEQLLAPIKEFFVIVNITTIRSDAIVEAFKKSKNKFGMIALDEAHRCITGDTAVDTNIGLLSVNELYKKDLSGITIKSYNIDKAIIEYKPILNVINNKLSEKILELIVETPAGIVKLKCTESHKIFTINRGWVEAKFLTEDDDIKIC